MSSLIPVIYMKYALRVQKVSLLQRFILDTRQGMYNVPTSWPVCSEYTTTLHTSNPWHPHVMYTN